MMEQIVKRRSGDYSIDADWDKAFWADVPAMELKNYMSDRPEHFPKVQAKICYDNDNLFVIFRAEDKYVRAVAEKFNDPVCLDSCVEFFFSGRQRSDQGYFNLEVNCGGTLLLHQQVEFGQNKQVFSDEDCQQIEVASSLPKIVEPEIAENTTWTLEYRLPISILKKYDSIEQPGPGVVWRANFYKCGEKTSKPHWLTWAPVDNPRPNFHLPQFFGRLVFE